MNLYNNTIIHYSKNPSNKYKLEDYSIKYWEQNRTCWDSLEVFIKLNKTGEVVDWTFEGDTAIITTACASLFWESIIWKNIKEVLTLDYDYVKDLIWMDVSERRHKAATLWLLATRNAIHQEYLKDGITNDFSDILPN